MRNCLPPVLALLCLAAVARTAPSQLLVYFGTYTDGASKGVYVSRLTLATGALSSPQLAAETPNPSYLAVSADGRFLYAVNEVDAFKGQAGGSVSAFAVDRRTGALRPLNQQPTGGAGPAHLSLDRDGRTVLVANYGGGSVAALPIAKDGSVEPAASFVQHRGSSVNPDRQREPHAHQILADPLNRFVYAVDLGLDRVMIYRFDAAAHSLAPASPAFAAVAPGAGPRHLVLDRPGDHAYVINELNCTIAAFRRDAGTGSLTQFQTVPSLPPGTALEKTYSTAAIALSPSGAFLYGSNRGHDSISVFSVDRSSGALTYVANTPTGGRTPRGFDITPGGEFLIAGNQNSDTVVVFRIDAATGRLLPVDSRLSVGKPVDVKFIVP